LIKYGPLSRRIGYSSAEWVWVVNDNRYAGGVATFVLCVVAAVMSLCAAPLGLLAICGGSFGLVTVAGIAAGISAVLEAIGVSVFAGEVYSRIPNLARSYGDGYALAVAGAVGMFLAAVLYFVEMTPPPPAPVPSGSKTPVVEMAGPRAPLPITATVAPQAHASFAALPDDRQAKLDRRERKRARKEKKKHRSRGRSAEPLAPAEVPVVSSKRSERHRSRRSRSSSTSSSSSATTTTSSSSSYREVVLRAPTNARYSVPLEPLLLEEYRREGLSLTAPSTRAQTGIAVVPTPNWTQRTASNTTYIYEPTVTAGNGSTIVRAPSALFHADPIPVRRMASPVRTASGVYGPVVSSSTYVTAEPARVVRTSSPVLSPVRRTGSISPTRRLSVQQRPYDEDRYWNEGRPV
jgi:hypothetical protein